MSRYSSDTRLLAANTLISISTMLLGLGVLPNPVRLLVALPFVLLLPGMCIVWLLSEHMPRSAGERVVVAIAVSISLTIVIGLVLNETAPGLQRSSWAVVIGALTSVLATTAYVKGLWRGFDLELDSAVRDLLDSAPREDRRPPSSPMLAAASGAAMLAAVIVTIAVVAASRSDVARVAANEGVTELWALPGSSSTRTITVGVFRLGPTRQTYRAVLTAGRVVVRRWDAIVLSPGQRWTTTVTVSGGVKGRLRVDLYDGRSSGIFRSAWLAPRSVSQ